MVLVKKRLVPLLIAFALVFCGIAFLSTDFSYATTKAPAKVTGLKWKKTSSNYAKLSWKKANNAKKYEVYVGVIDEQGNYHWYKEHSVKKTSCSIGQDQLNTYYYKVRAVNGQKKGKFSSKIKVKIPVSKYTGYEVPDFGTLLWKDYSIKYFNDDATLLFRYQYDTPEAAYNDFMSYSDYMLSKGWKVTDALDDGKTASYVFTKSWDQMGIVFFTDSCEVVTLLY